jgi:hypothetical protein
MLHTGAQTARIHQFFPQPSVQLFSAFGDNQAAYEKNSPKLIDERGSFADKTISRAVE